MNTGMSDEELARHLDLSVEVVRKYLNSLEEKGLITRVKPKGFDSFWEDNKSMFVQEPRPRPIVKE